MYGEDDLECFTSGSSALPYQWLKLEDSLHTPYQIRQAKGWFDYQTV